MLDVKVFLSDIEDAHEVTKLGLDILLHHTTFVRYDLW
jgi:hypothetical protein